MSTLISCSRPGSQLVSSVSRGMLPKPYENMTLHRHLYLPLALASPACMVFVSQMLLDGKALAVLLPGELTGVSTSFSSSFYSQEQRRQL